MSRRDRRHPERSTAARRWASLKQAAEYIGIDDVRTIRRWISEGRITGYKLNQRVLRVDLNEIDAAMTPVGGGI
nr:helix-turn-helix domain-containing protein [Mycolicibacterium goodii]